MIRTALLVSIAACFFAACEASAPEEVDTATVVPVVTQPAQTGTIRAAIHATGTVAPAPGADLIVIAPEPARILEMPKAEGDRVSRGDLLVRFEIPSIGADSASRRAEVSRAEAGLRNAQDARARAHDLFDRGVAARKEVEDADRDASDAEARVAEAQAASQASDVIGRRTTVVATFAGVVARRSHNPGDIVEPSASDPILRIIDPARLEVVAAVPVTELSRITIGAAAHLIGQPGDSVPGLKVISRPALVEPGSASGQVRLAFTSAGRLAAGTPVELQIDAEQHQNVILVPASAIVRDGAETAVFLAVGDKAHRTPVEIGLSDGSQVEIISGLKVGDAVIIRGQLGLPDEADIKVGAAAK